MKKGAADNLFWGLSWGFRLASLWIVCVIIILYLGESPPTDSPDAFLQFVGMILLMGLASGGIVGLLRPLLDYGRIGSAIVGFFATVPLVAIGMSTSDGTIQFSEIDPLLVSVVSIIVGPVLGIGYYYIFRGGDGSL